MQLDMKVLVVDDQPPMRKIVQQFLKVIGFEDVETANNGAQALQKLKDSKTKPYGLALVDWDMPEMTGIEFLKHAAELDGPLPRFVMLTGRRELQDIREAGQFNIAGYIAKPVSRKTLEEKLKSIFD